MLSSVCDARMERKMKRQEEAQGESLFDLFRVLGGLADYLRDSIICKAISCASTGAIPTLIIRKIPHRSCPSLSPPAGNNGTACPGSCAHSTASMHKSLARRRHMRAVNGRLRTHKRSVSQ